MPSDQSPKSSDPKSPTPQKPKPDGRLGKLEQELYKRDESDTLKARQQKVSKIGIRKRALGQDPDVEEKRDVMFRKVAESRSKRRRRILIAVAIAGAIIIIAGLAFAGTYWYRVRSNVTNDQINVAINVPEAHTAGEEITYQVTYRNDSNVDWQSVELTLEPPEGFSFRRSTPEASQAGRDVAFNIGNLASGEEGTAEIIGRLIGEQGAALVAQAQLTITPENFPSGRFEQTTLATTTITAVPLNVSLELPQEARSGERVLATTTITNTSNHPISGAYVKLNPAAGVEFATEDPQFTEGFSVLDSEWEVPQLQPLETATYNAILFAQGEPGESRTLEAELSLAENGSRFVQQTSSSILNIAASQLTINQHYNSAESPLTVNTSQAVRAAVQYANTGTIGLQDAIVTVQFEGTGINEETLQLPTGAFNPTTKTITWTSASVPELALLQPQDSGEVTFDFEILPNADFPTDPDTAKNNAIIATATIDSPDISVPTGEENKAVSNRFVMSVASDLLLSADAFYDDGRLGIESTGPLPPNVGEETTYTVRLRAGSSINDIGNVRITAIIPDGLRYTGQTYSTVGEQEFNDRTGEIVWTIPQIAGITGRGSPAVEFHFQVAVTPAANQRGNEIDLLSRVSAVATDLFTDTEVTQTLTNLPTTETASPGQGRVE